MNVKDYVKQFNLTFLNIKEDYLDDFKNEENQERLWLGNLIDKLHLLKDKSVEDSVSIVISKLNSKVKFDENDTLALSNFVRNINTIINIVNRINNFKEGTLLDNGKHLKIYELFNEIKSADNLIELNIVLNKNLRAFLPHLFSIIKHLQNPVQYPIYFKYWRNILQQGLDKNDDYDSFTYFYREFPSENRHLIFASYLGTIGIQIAKNIKQISPLLKKESKDYKFLQNHVINLPKYMKLVDNIIDNKIPEIEKNILSVKEEFISWVIINDGNESNYFKKNFKSDIENLRKELDKYEIKYKESFNKELFIIDLNDLNEVIITISKNINNKNVKFNKFIGKLGTGGKEALLGKKNYLKFLKNHFKRNISTNKLINMSLNQILYGPPGTGKTYNTINKALEIVGEDLTEKTREEIKKIFDEKVKEGQIIFTTFHQNMSYEDFIEGIKPKIVNDSVIYEIEDGILKKISNKAFDNIISRNRKYQAPTFDLLHEEFLKEIEKDKSKETFIFTTITGREIKYIDLKGSSIIVMFRWQDSKNSHPATEPFTITKSKLKQLFDAGIDPSKITTLRETFRPFFSHNLSVFYAVYKKFYDFVREKYDSEILDEIEKDKLEFDELMTEWEIIESSKKEVLIEQADNFVIIIDEINRGNVSKIFGELITLIEESKRLHNPEAISAILPYSKKEFSVPNNVYILGTMNTADRSVESLDTALRRRFDFVEMMPNYSLINEENIEEYTLNSHYVFDILQTINDRIELLLGRDHLIGHSFFLMSEGENIVDKVKTAFYKNIIPLLQEYFYGDYNKIGLVIGSEFIKKEKSKATFADSSTFNASDYLGDNFVFKIIDYSDEKQFSDDLSFFKAIDILMGEKDNSIDEE